MLHVRAVHLMKMSREQPQRWRQGGRGGRGREGGWGPPRCAASSEFCSQQVTQVQCGSLRGNHSNYRTRDSGAHHIHGGHYQVTGHMTDPIRPHSPGRGRERSRNHHNFTQPANFYQPPRWSTPALSPTLRPPPGFGLSGGGSSALFHPFPHPPISHYHTAPHPPTSHHHTAPHPSTSHYHTAPHLPTSHHHTAPHPPISHYTPHSPTSHYYGGGAGTRSHRRVRQSVRRPWVRVSRPVEVGGAQPLTLSVMTYNILAQSLIEKNMYLYGETGEADLRWESRRQLLLQELKEAKADVVCLQEVEEQHYHDCFSPRLSALGYSGVYKKRTGDHCDGCAVFYHTSRLKVAEWKGVEFQRRVKVLDRDNVGIVIKFQLVNSSEDSPMFCVATTHLLFNPRAGEVKLAQLACLLSELDRMTSAPGQPRLPCLLCGDMNSIPLSPLLRFIENGHLDYSQLSGIQVAGYYPESSRKRPIPVPLLPSTVPIGQDCRYLSPASIVVSDSASSSGLSPSHTEAGDPAPRAVLSHPFTFSPAYPHPSTVSPPSTVTTYHTSAFETVDYIHYTPWTDSLPASLPPPHPPSLPPSLPASLAASHHTVTGPVSGDQSKPRDDPHPVTATSGGGKRAGFRLLSRRALLSTHTLLELGPQPHHLLPSDHLWLLACLQLIS